MRIGTHRLGQQRVKEHFAFFPITIKGETRWLERVKYVQEWYAEWGILGDVYSWHNVAFVTEATEKYYDMLIKERRKK